jgi:uncharacterized protein YggE
MRFRNRLLLPICLFVMLPGTTLAEPIIKGTQQELRALLLEQHKPVNISGYGELETSADRAVVSLVVKTNDSQLRAAIERNRRIRETMKKRLMEKGIAEADIQFSRFSNTPNYGFFGDKPSSYDISNEVKITITRESSLGDIAGIVDAQDDVHFVGSSIEHSLQEQSRQQALALALENAMAKKALYEKQLGIKLKAVKVTEHAVTPLPMAVMEQPRKQSYVASMGSAEAQRHFGEVIYRATVDVEFIAQ